jgi:NAD(P)-dependent dehydrogenase (short-subunit alcohol dehydrogenase family)
VGTGSSGAGHSGKRRQPWADKNTGVGRFGCLEDRQGLFDALAAQVPLGRLGKPEEVGKAVAFLASMPPALLMPRLFVDGGMAQI